MNGQRETLEEAKVRIIAENKQAKIDKINKLKRYPEKTEEYLALIDELEAIRVEGQFNTNQESIKWHHEMGKAVVDSGRDTPSERFAEDSHISPQVLNQCIRFYKKYPDLDKFLADKPKSISWFHIVHRLIPDPNKPRLDKRGPRKSEKVVWVKCPFCKSAFNSLKAEREILKDEK